MEARCVLIEPNNEIDKLLHKYCVNDKVKGFVEIGAEKICLNANYKKYAQEIEDFEVKNNDIFLTSHPKTGTTWVQEMIWMIVHNLDFEGAKDSIFLRSPFLEFSCLNFSKEQNGKKSNFKLPVHLENSVNYTKNHKSNPRIIKTHLPWCLLPKQIKDNTKKPKIIHISRNAKDTCVSYYHHVILKETYNGNFDDFCKLFIAGRLNWGPFWTNVLSYWEKRNEPNVLFIRYEEMKNDLSAVIKKVAEFLEKSLTDEQVSLLADHLSFEKMRDNKAVNHEDHFHCAGKQGRFMRAGIVGSFKIEMSNEQIELFDQWIKKENSGTGYVD